MVPGNDCRLLPEIIGNPSSILPDLVKNQAYNTKGNTDGDDGIKPQARVANEIPKAFEPKGESFEKFLPRCNPIGPSGHHSPPNDGEQILGDSPAILAGFSILGSRSLDDIVYPLAAGDGVFGLFNGAGKNSHAGN